MTINAISYPQRVQHRCIASWLSFVQAHRPSSTFSGLAVHQPVFERVSSWCDKKSQSTAVDNNGKFQWKASTIGFNISTMDTQVSHGKQAVMKRRKFIWFTFQFNWIFQLFSRIFLTNHFSIISAIHIGFLDRFMKRCSHSILIRYLQSCFHQIPPLDILLSS